MFLTLSEIASGMARHNATAMEYSMCLSAYKALTVENKERVQAMIRDHFKDGDAIAARVAA